MEFIVLVLKNCLLVRLSKSMSSLLNKLALTIITPLFVLSVLSITSIEGKLFDLDLTGYLSCE